MGVSPDHASNVPLILYPNTDSITPKYHVIFDDHFATVVANEEDMPDFTQEEWEKMFGDSTLQYNVDESIEEISPTPNNQSVQSETNTSRDRAWASDLKYPAQPIETVPPVYTETSLDPMSVQNQPIQYPSNQVHSQTPIKTVSQPYKSSLRSIKEASTSSPNR